MAIPHLRLWFGICQFSGLEKFYFGTVEAENELEAERKLKDLWRTIIPCEPPKTITCIPGHILIEREHDGKNS